MKRVIALGLCCLLLIPLIGCQQTTTILSEDETMATVDDRDEIEDAVGKTEGTAVADAAGKTVAG